RFTELKESCSNDKTRAERIKALKRGRFIEAKLIEIEGRSTVYYTLTNRGKEALNLLKRLENMVSEEQ
ncbi:MAG: winged helix-turn-helix transcriptional regulator, partial [Nitrososphaerales archaeon]